MKLIYIITACLILLLVITVGCAREELVSSHQDGKFHAKLLLNVMQPTTRSTVFEEEVRRLDIMLFKNGKLEKLMRNITVFGESSEGAASVDISFVEEGTRQAFVIANMDDESWLDGLSIGTTAVDYIYTIQTKVLATMPQPPLVMYGISGDISFSASGGSVNCSLYRVVARIDVVNKAKDFTLLSARLIRSKRASMVFPGNTQSKAAIMSFESEEAKEGQARLYSYENADLKEDGRTTVEVNGTVNDVPLTYVVNFSEGEDQIPIDRNNRYIVSINDVQKNTITTSIKVKPWKEGGDLDEVLTGDKPVVDVNIEPATGTYSAVDSSFTITPMGGKIVFSVEANAECDISLSETSWLQNATTTRASSVIDSRFEVSVLENTVAQSRSAEISIYNKLNKTEKKFSLTQAPAEVGDRYMVLVVAGQSNAVGYDESALEASDLETNSRVLQLSYRRGQGVAPSIIPLTWCADDVDARKESAANASGQKGLKGIHLPLSKELLKHVPAGYKILVIPVAYASSRFSSTNGSVYGTYNSQSLAPNEMTTALRWGVNSAYRTTIVERTKYALNLDSRNKLLGFVWCQGENDRGNSDYHYAEFTAMTDRIFKDLNSAGYGSRTNYGTVDKRSWFSYSSCVYWVDWHSPEDASAVFGGYKQWNPDNFIHVPITTPVNPQGGPGMGKYHFGLGAYQKVIAPMVAERMNANGALFNGVTPAYKHFTDQTTRAQAEKNGGNKADEDISSSLIMSLPFTQSVLEEEKGEVGVNSNLSLTDATGLVDIERRPRNRKALALSGGDMRIRYVPTTTDWSFSFMFKRTGNWSNLTQTIIAGTYTTSPFIGFKEYAKGNGVAGAAEFVVAPVQTTIKTESAAGQFMAANKVRALDEWVHYVVTYKEATRELSIYMNAELVQRKKLTNTSSTKLSTLFVGSEGEDSAKGMMMDLMLWGKVLESSTITKLFLMSYYGYTK